MAKVIPNPIIQSIHGKTHSRDNMYYRTGRRSGKVFAIARRENYHFNYSEAQAANRQQFGQRSRRLRAWYREQQEHPTALYLQLMDEFRHQTPGAHALDNPYDYLLRNYDVIFK